MRHKALLTALCLTLLLPAALTAQGSEGAEKTAGIAFAYDKGNQTFGFTAGPFVPLFTQDMSGNTYPLDNTSIGGAGSLEWGAFFAKNQKLGFEFGGMYTFTPNRVLSMIPITAKYTYYFINYPFEFPVYLGAGLCLNSLNDFFTLTPILKPGASAFWNFNPEWAVGINFQYWWVPEIYFGGDFAEQSRFGNFLEISLSAVYHF